MKYQELVEYQDKESLIKNNVIWDHRRFFVLEESEKLLMKDDLILALYSNRIVFVYQLDTLQLRSGILIGKKNRYSIQEMITDISLTQAALVWYENSIHLCLIYS